MVGHSFFEKLEEKLLANSRSLLARAARTRGNAKLGEFCTVCLSIRA
jgi:hypothetical protein